jgi:thioredoxin-dependent peroxiredoxin
MSAFRDLFAKFADADAQVLGVSMDDLDTQKKFAESLKTPFPLLVDPAGKVVSAYGVLLDTPHGHFANRVTFVIGKDGKITKEFEGAQALDPSGALDACHATP